MSDLIWLSEAQMRRIEPYFPLSHGVPRVLSEQWGSTFPSWLSRFRAARSPRFVPNLICFRSAKRSRRHGPRMPRAGKRTNCWLV